MPRRNRNAWRDDLAKVKRTKIIDLPTRETTSNERRERRRRERAQARRAA